MSIKVKIITLITIASLIEVILVRPFIPAFFGMNLSWKILYVLLLFGYPLLTVIPLALVTIPFVVLFKGKRSFKPVWYAVIQNTFLIFGIIILFFNTALLITKYGVGRDPFPLKKYSQIKGYQGDISDLKVGEFEYDMGKIKRSQSQQTEYYKNGETKRFKLIWLTKNEYRMVNQGESIGMHKTLDVKITNNTPAYYECYTRFGEYAKYLKINKN
jgi:hypothetical protein